MAPGLLSSAAGAVVRRASRHYVAGPGLEDAQHLSGYLAGQGYWIAQGYWDGAGDTPQGVRDLYLGALEQLARLGGDNYLSLKIPALGFDPELYEPVLAQSRRLGVGLHFDSLAPEHAGRIDRFIRERHAGALTGIGCTLPGRWRRSVADAEAACDLGLTVRVVKGQWEDPERRIDPRAGCMQLIARLAGRAPCVRVATHDMPLARAALRRLRAHDTRCELELLYGLPQVPELVALAMEMAVPVRIYVAFGHACLPYALSSLRKNPATVLKLLKEACRRDYLSSFPPCGRP